MRKYKLFIGYRLLGEFSGIWEAKNFAAESGMSGIFSLVGENYRDSWYEPKNRTRMETKIKDITGAEITVTDLKEAVRQCRECLASPYLMPSGHTVGENHAYMLRQLLALQRRKREHGRHGRENTTRKNRTITTVRFFCFPSIDRRMVAQLPVQFTPDMSGNATGRNFRD